MDLNLNKLDPSRCTLEVNVHVTRQFWFRFWLAKHCFKFGAWLIGCNLGWHDKDAE